jgi:pre-mRNA-splicing factor 38A
VCCFDFGRWVLEASGTLEPRRSALEDDFEEEDKEEEQPMEIDESNGRENVSALYNKST